MKAQILKIAGVKNEKEFYAKFPTEESFMAKHGKTLKAQSGLTTGPNQYVGQGSQVNDFYRYNAPTNNGPQPQFQGYESYNPYFTTNPGWQQGGFPQPTDNIGFESPNMVGGGSDPGFDMSQNRQQTGDYSPMNATGEAGKTDFIGKGIPIVGSVLGGLSALEGEKQKRKQAEQAKAVSEVTLKASTTRPEMRERRYVRPEDNVFSTNQFFPANGVGTNVLAKKGITMEAQEGADVSSFGDSFGETSPYANMAGSFFDNNAGSQIGGGIGSIFGPAGNVAGTIIGGALDTNGRRTKKAMEAAQRNIMNMSLNNMAPSVQAGYASYLEDGGDVSGMEHDGELQTYGGKAELMSYNPFIQDGGETVMFKGPSHDDGGIGITYGGSPVEVEGGEPAVRMNGDLTVFGNLKINKELSSMLGDPKASGKKFKNYIADLSKQEVKANRTAGSSLEEIDALDVITPFDKLKFSSLQANVLGTTMKLKDIAAKKNNAALLQDSINSAAEEHGLDADALAKGKMKQAKNGMDIAQNGKYKVKGQSEGKWSYTPAGETGNPLWDTPERYDGEWTPNVGKALGDPARAQKIIQYIEGYNGEGADNVRKALASKTDSKDKISLLQEQATNRQVGPMHYVTDAAIRATAPVPEGTTQRVQAPVEAIDKNYEVVPYKRNKMADLFNQVLPFIRPTDQEALDPTQLYGEMYALSNNSVDPVQAQSYQPDLGTPYDISYQDQLNANNADYRAMSRTAAYNPAAQSILAGQKYSANERVLGDQFRANQAMKDRVYGENRNILNDAKLKNLAIYDKQYERQSEAVSNTKATAQAAISSIADKYAKHNLENRTLGIYENLYNYRFDDAGRAINMNPLFQPNMPYIYGPDGKVTHKIIKDDKGNIIGYEPIDITAIPVGATPPLVSKDYAPIAEVPAKKNGGQVKYSQSSLVKQFK